MKKVCVFILLLSAVACGNVAEEDISPVVLEDKVSCIGDDCNGEDPVKPPCYPNC